VTVSENPPQPPSWRPRIGSAEVPWATMQLPPLDPADDGGLFAGARTTSPIVLGLWAVARPRRGPGHLPPEPVRRRRL